MGTIGTFDFTIDFHGARVVIQKEPLCSACMSGGEVDAQIKLLKEDLDAVAKRMKAAIRRQAARPLKLG